MSLEQAEAFIQRMVDDQQFRSRFFDAPSDQSRRALLDELGLECEFAEVQKVLASKGQHITEEESELIASAMLGNLSDESLEFITGGGGGLNPFLGATGGRPLPPPFGMPNQGPGPFPFFPGTGS